MNLPAEDRPIVHHEWRDLDCYDLSNFLSLLARLIECFISSEHWICNLNNEALDEVFLICGEDDHDC